MFPEGQFVIIHRHGLDQAHSTTRGGTWVRQELETVLRRRDEDPQDRCDAVLVREDGNDPERVYFATHPDQCVELHYAKMCAPSPSAS